MKNDSAYICFYKVADVGGAALGPEAAGSALEPAVGGALEPNLQLVAKVALSPLGARFHKAAA